MAKETKIELRPEVAEVYEIVNWPYPGPKGNLGKFGSFNFNRMNLVMANHLHDNKFPYLQKKPVKAPK